MVSVQLSVVEGGGGVLIILIVCGRVEGKKGRHLSRLFVLLEHTRETDTEPLYLLVSEYSYLVTMIV